MAKILVGTPAYGGQLSTAWFRSMHELIIQASKRGIDIAVITLDKESLITRARNYIVAEFLGRTEFTHLFFLDSDIGFNPATLFRLIEADKPLSGAAYPMKEINWAKVHTLAQTSDDVQLLRRESATFAINMFDEDFNGDNESGGYRVINGMARVSKIGTGFMLIQRTVFDQLREKFPDKSYVNDLKGYENAYTSGNFWSFFDIIIHPESRRYLSEDYGFCHLWTEGCGGEIWCDIVSNLSHFGVHTYSGSYLDSSAIT